MKAIRRAFAAVILALAASVALPANGVAETDTATGSAAIGARAQLKNCAPFTKAVKARSGKAKRNAARSLAACRKQNRARKIVARQVAGYALVGTRGDGESVDWRHCANGRWLHYTDGSYGRAISDGRSWRISHAIVRQGGKWFDAVLTQPLKGGKMSVGIARRGKQFQVAIVSFDTDLSSYGNATRTKITNKDCVRPS